MPAAPESLYWISDPFFATLLETTGVTVASGNLPCIERYHKTPIIGAFRRYLSITEIYRPVSVASSNVSKFDLLHFAAGVV